MESPANATRVEARRRSSKDAAELVSYQLNVSRGRHTELTVGPVDGYQPDPGHGAQAPRPHGNRHKDGAGTNWASVGKAGSEASYTV